MTGPIRNTVVEREYDSYVESPTRSNKTAVEVAASFSAGAVPMQPPANTDYISSVFSSNVQTVIYKSGGASGTTLKTITITYTGCDFTLVIS